MSAISALRIDWSEPGTVVSAAAHAALLVAILVGFSSATKLDDTPEAIPVETISDAQFNQLMRGEKTAKKSMPQPQAKVDKVAPVEVRKQARPTPETKVDVPAPPPRLRPVRDPGRDDHPDTAPPKAAALPPVPPPKPVPNAAAKPQPVARHPSPPAKAEPKPDKPDAEVVERAKPQKPKRDAEDTHSPTPKPRPVDERPVAKPKVEPKHPTDKVARLLEERQLEALAADPPPKPVDKPRKHHAKPKSGTAAADALAADLQFLNKAEPRSTGSTGRKLAPDDSLGAPDANAPKLSGFFVNQLNDLIRREYYKCWSNAGLADGDYVPRFDIHYNRDWSLASAPVLLNRPTNAKQRAIADSALRAIKDPRCDPLSIPASYATYYEQWKREVIKFEPTGDGSSG